MIIKIFKRKKILKDYLHNNLENFDFDENEKQTKILEENFKNETQDFEIISRNRRYFKKVSSY